MLSTGLCLLGCNLRAQSMLLASVSKVHSTPVVAVGYTVTPMRSVGTQFSWWCCMGTKFIHGASWVHSASVVSVGFTIHQLCQLSTQRTSSMTVIAPQCSWKARHSLFIQFNVSYWNVLVVRHVSPMYCFLWFVSTSVTATNRFKEGCTHRHRYRHTHKHMHIHTHTHTHTHVKVII